MLNNLRNPLPAIENAGEMAADRVKKAANSAAQAANSAAQAAKDATTQLEDWAKDGYGSAREAVKTKPFMWGAASLGLGALMGGLYTLWRRGAAKDRPTGKTLPARARAKQSLATDANGANRKQKPKRARRAGPSTYA